MTFNSTPATQSSTKQYLTSSQFDSIIKNSITHFSASNVLCPPVFQQLSHESTLSLSTKNQAALKIIEHIIIYLKNSK
jgi:hypothetical protein